MNKINLVFLIAFLLFTFGCSHTQRLCKYTLNPDVTCRVCDENEERGKLIEFFDSDTNELRLFVVSRNSEVEIVHPYGLASGVGNKVKENVIVFDPNNHTQLLVNGERFAISVANKP